VRTAEVVVVLWGSWHRRCDHERRDLGPLFSYFNLSDSLACRDIAYVPLRTARTRAPAGGANQLFREDKAQKSHG
jgi:hypothetical protein